jgi:hypothetical protein
MMSFQDALLQTANGRKIVVESKERSTLQETKRNLLQLAEESRKSAERTARLETEAIRLRIRSLKELAHSTFVEMPKVARRRVRFDLYLASKDNIRAIGIAGGQEYDKTVMALKHAPESKKSFYEAVEMMTVSLDS